MELRIVREGKVEEEGFRSVLQNDLAGLAFEREKTIATAWYGGRW